MPNVCSTRDLISTLLLGQTLEIQQKLCSTLHSIEEIEIQIWKQYLYCKIICKTISEFKY